MRVVPALFLPMINKEYLLPNSPDFGKKSKECVLTGFTFIAHKNEIQDVICIMLGAVELMTIYPENEERPDLVIYQNSKYQTIEDLAGLATFTEHAIKLYNI